MEYKMVVARAWWGQGGNNCLTGTEVQFGKFWRWSVVVAVQQCEMYLMPVNHTLKDDLDSQFYVTYVLLQ